MPEEKVLITGGAGYIGSVLTKHLLDKEYKVTCLDNLFYNQQVPYFNGNPNFNFVSGDVREEKILKEIVPDFDVIIPLAAIVGMPACEKDQIDAIRINYGSIALLDYLRSSHQKLIFPTTNSGYGAKTGDVDCTEETPLEPISLYGITKCAAEKHLFESDKGAITLRLATVFGMSPRMRTDLLVNDFVLMALNDGKIGVFEEDFKRNYAHIKDIAECFLHCIRNYDKMKGRCYNVGLDSANLSKRELAERVKQQVPKLEIYKEEGKKDPDKRNYIVSNKRLKEAGFECRYSLDDGIKELIDGYKKLNENGISYEALREEPYRNV